MLKTLYHMILKTVCDSETAHTKRKLKLAESWMEIRDRVYSAIISTYALREAEWFICQTPAFIRCTQCGPCFMCLQCCVQVHSMHNIHHILEMWKVCTYMHLSNYNYVLCDIL